MILLYKSLYIAIAIGWLYRFSAMKSCPPGCSDIFLDRNKIQGKCSESSVIGLLFCASLTVQYTFKSMYNVHNSMESTNSVNEPRFYMPYLKLALRQQTRLGSWSRTPDFGDAVPWLMTHVYGLIRMHNHNCLSSILYGFEYAYLGPFNGFLYS